MDKETRCAWHGSGASLEFEPSDFDILDLVLGQIPELRICALALKRARASKLRFPICEPRSLFGLIEGGNFEGGGHHIGHDDVSRYMPLEFFPINNEGELVSRTYIALIRCKHEATLKLHASLNTLTKQQVLVHPGESK